MNRPIMRACAAGLALASLFATAAAAEVKHYTYVVLTSPLPGQDDAYNDWYTHVHVPDLLKIPGIKSAQRFEAAPEDASADHHRYVTIFDVETDDLNKVKAAIRAAVGTPEMRISPAIDMKSVSSTFYEAITPKMTGAH